MTPGSAPREGQPSSESLRQDDELEHPRHSTSRLDPVQERKSEYGMEGLLASKYSAAGSVQDTSRVPPKSSQDESINPTYSHTKLLPEPRETGGIAPPGLNTVPTLPALGRLSGFGEGLWSASRRDDHSDASRAYEHSSNPASAIRAMDAPNIGPGSLQHQPSFGFRSVVHEAFDRKTDKSVPPTPSSTSDSLRSGAASDPRRSDSTSTTGISPIMTRAPSLPGIGDRLREGARENGISAIAEEGSPESPASPPEHRRAVPTAESGSPLHANPPYQRKPFALALQTRYRPRFARAIDVISARQAQTTALQGLHLSRSTHVSPRKKQLQ